MSGPTSLGRAIAAKRDQLTRAPRCGRPDRGRGFSPAHRRRPRRRSKQGSVAVRWMRASARTSAAPPDRVGPYRRAATRREAQRPTRTSCGGPDPGHLPPLRHARTSKSFGLARQRRASGGRREPGVKRVDIGPKPDRRGREPARRVAGHGGRPPQVASQALGPLPRIVAEDLAASLPPGRQETSSSPPATERCSTTAASAGTSSTRLCALSGSATSRHTTFATPRRASP
jgi:hypothetical protein